MKTIAAYITPLLIACFLTFSTEGICQNNGIVSTNVVLSYSLELKNWGTLYNSFGAPITSINLANATYNPTNGLTELYVEAFVCTNAENSFFLAAQVVSTTDTGLTITNALTSISITKTNGVPQTPIVGPQLVDACAGLIIAIVVIIVGGIIVYVLLKTCKRLLPPPEKGK